MPYRKEMHSKDATVLIWFNVVHYSSLFQYFLFDLLYCDPEISVLVCYDCLAYAYRIKTEMELRFPVTYIDYHLKS